MGSLSCTGRGAEFLESAEKPWKTRTSKTAQFPSRSLSAEPPDRHGDRCRTGCNQPFRCLRSLRSRRGRARMGIPAHPPLTGPPRQSPPKRGRPGNSLAQKAVGAPPPLGLGVSPATEARLGTVLEL